MLWEDRAPESDCYLKLRGPLQHDANQTSNQPGHLELLNDLDKCTGIVGAAERGERREDEQAVKPDSEQTSDCLTQRRKLLRLRSPARGPKDPTYISMPG